jgi:uncharacterized protein (TIGR02594 family)
MLPERYRWLAQEPGPLMLLEALKLFGVYEHPGTASSPIILAWATECELPTYDADSIPWCGLFMAVVARRAKKTLPANPLWARDWLRFGDPCEPELGAVLVFERGTGGHVGLYVGEDSTHYHVLGGNQKDQVCISRLNKGRLIGARCQYKIKPGNVRRVTLPSDAEESNDES